MIYATNVKVCPENLTLTVGKWCYDLCATVEPSNATCKSVWWHSSNPLIVAVNYSNGYIFAKSTGTATIYATACDGSGVRSCCTVTVTEPILATGVNVLPLTAQLEVGASIDLCGIVLPTNATVQCLFWTTSNKNVVTVNPDTGLIYAVSPGTATIHATVCDASGAHGSCEVTVVPPPASPVPVTGVTLDTTRTTIKVGEKARLCANVSPENATNKDVIWVSLNSHVAFVDPYTGLVSALNPGIATIRATTDDGNFQATCEVWVPGKTPVFLIHGRTSNSHDTWGATNKIRTDPKDNDNNDNNHFDSSLTAYSTGSVSSQNQYIKKETQDISGYYLSEPIESDDLLVERYWIPGVFNGKIDDGKYITQHPEGGNLAYYLKQNGYKENVNLFVFNYPNEDAVVHSAEKFKAYIENLLEYVRTSGSDEMKACFYRARSEYLAENHKINIVGHSMGGLVARYYIENIGEDYHVNKLITICTPHWGSGYADVSNESGIKHKLCDHDLDFNSAMFGGTNSIKVNCDKNACPENEYSVTKALQYQGTRLTKYYAIAGIDYDAAYVNLNDHPFEMPTNFTTSQEIVDYLVSKKVYKLSGKDSQIKVEPNPQKIGDNMVGFLSQIGWIGDKNNATTPEPKIKMERIFVDVDTNGGNGGEAFIWEAIMEWLFGDALLHNKIPHRTPILEKIIEFLGE